MTHSAKTIEILINYYEEGKKVDFICRTLGMRRGTAQYHLMRHGAWRFPSCEKLPRCTKDTSRSKAWTEAEEQRLLELRTSGLSVTACARALGRSYSSARTRLLILAAHESYREDQL